MNPLNMHPTFPPSFDRRQTLLQARLKRQHALEARRSSSNLPRTPPTIELRISPSSETWSTATIAELRKMPLPDIATYMAKPLPLLPVPDKVSPPLVINEDIDKYTLLEVAVRLHKTFEHIPHAISGSAAIAVEENFRLPFQIRHVSLITPPECLRAVKCWATACGLPDIPSLPSGFGIKTSDGRVCIIKLKKFTDPFEKLDIRLVGGEFKIPIVTIRSIANRIARCYIRDMNRKMPLKIQQDYYRDMRWAINCMIRNDTKFRDDKPPTWILDRRFWLPFNLSFPDMADLFEKVGLSVRMGETVIVPWSDEEQPRQWWEIAGQRGPSAQVRSTSCFDSDVNNDIRAKILGIRLIQERVRQQRQKKEREQNLREEKQKHQDAGQNELEAEEIRPLQQELRKLVESPVLPPQDRKIQLQEYLLRGRSPQEHLEMRRQELFARKRMQCCPSQAETRMQKRKMEIRHHLLRRCEGAQDLRSRQ